jgi:hypothetical protein
VKVRLIIPSSNTFGFRAVYNTSIAYLNYELVDRTIVNLFGKVTKSSEGITIYLNQEKNIRNFNPDLAKIVEIVSSKDRLMLTRQRKS